MDDYLLLNNGKKIPPIGFGTWKITDGADVIEAVQLAIQTGYRLIDTAKIYDNEVGVGSGIHSSGVPREELFITTKLWNDDFGEDSAVKAYQKSLERLELEYVDLYLLHWPVTNKRRDAWKGLEKIYQAGQAKSIGVSNYTVRHLEELLSQTDIVPAVNQIEFHPFLFDQQREVLNFCQSKNILVEGYSPLAHAERFNDAVITEIAKKYSKTNAQIMLRWAVQHGVVPIPKSSHQERIEENFTIFNFEIDEADMKRLDELGEGLRTCSDPNEMA